MTKTIPTSLAGLLLLILAAVPAAAQSCATIGSSTFCGARGSHNTIGNTMIFNTGPAGQRSGNYMVTGTPPRTTIFRGTGGRGLVGPRTFAGVATARRFEPYDSAIARLRAEILAIEAQYQQQQMLDQLQMTPAQQAARAEMSPALLRALTLAQQARLKAAE
mgnify:CR=1 FL=1